ncbi:MAG: hypothetical protein NWE94_03225 [Candidatus Bathyarchaeota archaeon]|nr:hypothetical protein [Candidatus Bathyarchaeota archaeon]
MNLKKPTAMLLGFLLLLLAFSTFCVAEVQPDSVADDLQAVSNAFEEAFGAVLAAEQAGANVTVLLVRLNRAGDLLASAEVAYRRGDAGAAAERADAAFQIAVEVRADAVGAEEAALGAYQNALWFNSLFSVTGGVVFVVVLFFTWQRVKQRHFGKLCCEKPEVVGQ